MTGAMPMPAPLISGVCEKAELVVAGNIGVGASLELSKIGLGGTVGKILGATGTLPSDEFFNIQEPVFKTPYTAYKNGFRCLGDQ